MRAAESEVDLVVCLTTHFYYLAFICLCVLSCQCLAHIWQHAVEPSRAMHLAVQVPCNESTHLLLNGVVAVFLVHAATVARGRVSPLSLLHG